MAESVIDLFSFLYRTDIIQLGNERILWRHADLCRIALQLGIRVKSLVYRSRWMPSRKKNKIPSSSRDDMSLWESDASSVNYSLCVSWIPLFSESFSGCLQAFDLHHGMPEHADYNNVDQISFNRSSATADWKRNCTAFRGTYCQLNTSFLVNYW